MHRFKRSEMGTEPEVKKLVLLFPMEMKGLASTALSESASQYALRMSPH